ncbi:MAG: nucleoside phosphorylase [Oscillospiraceae bacterium]
MVNGKTLYGQCAKGDIAKYVLLSGDPWRVDVLAKNLENPKHIAFSREFNTYTGAYKGVEITVSSTGMGAPTAAIAMEELYECGMEVAVRMGTNMVLNENDFGKYIVPIGAMREEGTSTQYAPLSYPAIADAKLVHYLSEGVKDNGFEVVNGLVCTRDAFYIDFRESKFSMERNVDILGHIDELRKYGVSSLDMECSALLTIGRLMGVKVAQIALGTVKENLKEFMYGEEKAKNEEVLCKVALDGLVKYAKSVD